MRRPRAFQRWLFHLARDEQVPIVLTQRRIFIVPTPAASFRRCSGGDADRRHQLQPEPRTRADLSARRTRLVAMVHTFHNLFGLRLTPGRAEPTFAGDLARFPLALENPRRQSRRALEFSFGTSRWSRLTFRREGPRDVAVPFAHTSVAASTPGRVTLATRYPLGLFRAWSYPYPPVSCVVYPKPLRTPLPGAVAGSACRPSPGRQRPGRLRRSAPTPDQRPDPAHRLESGGPPLRRAGAAGQAVRRRSQ
jgi:hypothetical protein